MTGRFICLRSALCVTLLVVAGACASKDLIIGEISPLSGALGDTGKDIALGIKVYIDSVNAAGGVNGRKIQILLKDDAYQPTQTVTLAKELADNQDVLLLLGAAGSAAHAELLEQKVLANSGLAEIGPYTGSPSLREPFADTKNIFHTRASYTQEAKGIVEQLMALNMDKIAVFSQNDAFGKAGLEGVNAALKKYNKTIVASGTFEPNCDVETCLDNAVRTIAAADPSAVVLWATNKYSATFVKKIKPVSRIVQFMSVSVVNPATLYRMAGESNARGIGIAQVVPFPYATAPRVVNEFKAALKKYGNGARESHTGLEEFINAKVAVEALRRAGPDPTREKVYHALETMTDYDVGGFPIRFSPTDHAQSKFIEITVIAKDGKLFR